MTSVLIPFSIWLAPVVGALLTPVFARVHPKLRDLGAVAFVFLAALACTLVALFVPAGDYSVPWIPALNVRAGVLIDPLSMFMVNIVAWVSFLIMVYSLEYMKGDSGLTRYWFFMCLFIGNMLLLVLADNLLLMLFGWEGVGLCSYALIGHWYKDEKEYWVGTPGDTALGLPQAYPPSHAGMKAFLFTRVGDIALMISIFLIYAFSGTFSYTALAAQLGGTSSWAASLARLGLLIPTALLFFGGPVGKSAQFPLQEWLPDAMAGPTSVSALIHAATMVKAGVFLTGRMGPIFFLALSQFNQVYPFFATIAWIGAFTAFLAATQATVAREIKKVLAYSTVSQIGYMMLALGVAGLSADFAIGYTAGLFHVMSHAIFKASLFLAAGWVLHATESRFMDQMGGLARGMRITAASMLLAGLSLMGIPPLSGFWTKDAILSATFGADQLALSRYALYGLGIATVVLTAFYTMRMLGMTFTGKPSQHIQELEEEGHHVHEAKLVMVVPYLLLAAGSLVLGVAYPFINQRLTDYLVGTFNILPSALPAAQSTESNLLTLTLIGVSVGAAVIGAALGYFRYFNKDRAYSAPAFGVRKFLWERWYLNALYYKVFVNGALAASRVLYRYVEQGVWDRLSYVVARDVVDYSKASQRVDTGLVDRSVNNVASGGSRLSTLFRRLQNGVTEQYVIAFAVGIFLLLAWMIFVIGVS
jgi:NADH-quinone oxidoreductase subunit L